MHPWLVILAPSLIGSSWRPSVRFRRIDKAPEILIDVKITLYINQLTGVTIDVAVISIAFVLESCVSSIFRSSTATWAVWNFLLHEDWTFIPIFRLVFKLVPANLPSWTQPLYSVLTSVRAFSWHQKFRSQIRGIIIGQFTIAAVDGYKRFHEIVSKPRDRTTCPGKPLGLNRRGFVIFPAQQQSAALKELYSIRQSKSQTRLNLVSRP
jgi:hypothetical protein